MLVNLARNWFDPSGSLREKRFNPHDVQDNWKDVLPPGADIVDEGGKVVEAIGGPDDKAEDGLAKKPSGSTPITTSAADSKK